MNQAKLRILMLLCGCTFLFFGVSQTSYAQILKDRGKLKTVRSEGRGFVLFARKIKTQSPKKKKTKKRSVSPGSSAPLFGSRIKSVSPRYSRRRFVAGNPNAGTRYTPAKKRVKRRGANPRYSASRNEPVELLGSPRYTPKPRRTKKYGVSPRFSPSRREPVELLSSPRYTPKPRRIKRYGVAPRYSPSRGGAVELSESPRYSAKPNRRKKVVVAPRYSTPRTGVVAPYEVRYSKVAKRGKKPTITPRYSQSKRRNYKVIKKPGFSIFEYLLAIPGGVILAVRPHDERLAQYRGDLKKRDVDKHQTKNRNYVGGARREIKIVRNFRTKRMAKSLMTYNGGLKRKTAFFQKLSNKKRSRLFSDVIVPSGYNKHRKNADLNNVSPKMVKVKTRTGKTVDKKVGRLRTKVDGNKNQPPSVRGKSKKLKFDKKEKGLWYE
ncbi:MAG: hypothetical protein AAGJ93_15215 [Bacteroidota bacterium]